MKKDMDCNINPDNIPFCDPKPEECCCKDAIRYALNQLNSEKTLDEVILYSPYFHGYGRIVEAPNDKDFVKLSDGAYYSLCNIDLILFKFKYGNKFLYDLEPYNCSTPECCCNHDLAKLIRYKLGDLPTYKDLSILLSHYFYLYIDKVYGLCNGILWVKLKYGYYPYYFKYAAIPLCSIFKIYFDHYYNGKEELPFSVVKPHFDIVGTPSDDE